MVLEVPDYSPQPLLLEILLPTPYPRPESINQGWKTSGGRGCPRKFHSESQWYVGEPCCSRCASIGDVQYDIMLFRLGHAGISVSTGMGLEPIPLCLLKDNCIIHLKIHLFKVYNAVAFSVFTKLCNHHHCLILDQFYHPKRKPYAYYSLSIFPSPQPLAC